MSIEEKVDRARSLGAGRPPNCVHCGSDPQCGPLGGQCLKCGGDCYNVDRSYISGLQIPKGY